MDNNREFDYSGLYHNNNTAPQNGAAQPEQPQNAQQPYGAQAPSAQQPYGAPYGAAREPAQDGGYPNVGSSGANTANTARTEFGAGEAPAQSAAPQNGAPDANGYTSSFRGNGGSGGNGGGYSYASAPQQPPKKARGQNGKKIWTRIAAGVCVAALGVGGGFGGAVLASRAGLTGGNVVVQTVEHTGDSTAAESQGSTSGSALEMTMIALPSAARSVSRR